MTIHLADQTIVLLAEGAALLPRHDRTLIVADLHLGKSAAFRAAGLAIPEGDTHRDLQRLAQLCRHHQAQHLVVAGDLFPSRAGLAPEVIDSFQSFVQNNGIPLTLVRGNHDAPIDLEPLQLCVLNRLKLDGIHVVHDPADARDEPFHVTGHLHPAVAVADPKARRRLRLPCFLLRENRLVLPAFGGFTGSATLAPQPGDRFFVPLDQHVAEVPPQLLKR